jgi:hypothetical protein
VFEPRRLHYRWHPWHGHDVLTRKTGGGNAATAYLCRLPNMGPEATLVELPRWMFDPAQCAAMRVEARPQVDCATLRILKNTIADLRASATGSMLQPYRFPESESRRHK